MGRIPKTLKRVIAQNIKACREKYFPGHGGGKKCAESFGVSPQQWSPWETGVRTPDEERLEQIAKFFEVTVEYLRRDNSLQQEEKNRSISYYSEDRQNIFSKPLVLAESAPPQYPYENFTYAEGFYNDEINKEIMRSTSRLFELLLSLQKMVTEQEIDKNFALLLIKQLIDLVENRLLDFKK